MPGQTSQCKPQSKPTKNKYLKSPKQLGLVRDNGFQTTFRSFVGARRHGNFSFISSRFFSVSIFGMQWHRHLLADMLTFSYLDKNNGWHMDVKISTDKFMVVITIFYHSTLAIYWKVRYVFASLFLLLLRKANTKGQQHKNKSSQTP